jgi:fructokinase
MILCCGEALIDMIPLPTKDGPMGFVPHTGGAIFNTAIALGRLGIPTAMFSGIGDDQFGQTLLSGLKDSNVDISKIVVADRPTTLAFVHLVNGSAQYSFYDENSAGRGLTSEDLPTDLEEVSALYFGGISLASLPAADSYRALAERESSKRVIMLDPNIRPGFIKDEAAYRERLAAFLSIADIVKVSDEDLDWIVGRSENLSDQVAQLRKFGCRYVIVTRGAESLMLFGPDHLELSAPTQKVEVIDTVGAGDTFNAGFLASLSDQDLLKKDALASIQPAQWISALSYGAEVAAVTVSRQGANPPWKSEL